MLDVTSCAVVAAMDAGIVSHVLVWTEMSHQHPERLLVSRFIEDLTEGATLAANAQGVTLTVLSDAEGVAIDADQQVTRRFGTVSEACVVTV